MAVAEPLDPTSPEALPARKGATKTRKVLVKKAKPPFPVKKVVWLTGHALTLVFGFIYLSFYLLRYVFRGWYWIPRICFMLSFTGVLLSHYITIITTFGSSTPSYQTLISTENFQNFLLAGVWLVLRPSAFKLFPYYIVSLLQISSFFNVKFFLKFQNQMSDIISLSEIFVIIALIFDTLLFKGSSGFALIVYVALYWLRINFSPYTQAFILRIVRFIDNKIMVKQNPEVKAKWQKIKDFVEFRRSQTKRVIQEDLHEEPIIQPLSTNEPKDETVVGETENYQIIGDELDPDNAENRQAGVKLGTENAGKAPVGKKAPAGIADTKQKTYDQNFNAGVLAATEAAGAGYGAGFETAVQEAKSETISKSTHAHKK